MVPSREYLKAYVDSVGGTYEEYVWVIERLRGAAGNIKWKCKFCSLERNGQRIFFFRRRSYLADEVISCIVMLGEEFIFLIVMDGASVCIAAMRFIREKYRQIFTQ